MYEIYQIYFVVDMSMQFDKLFEVVAVYFSNTYFCKLYEQARDFYIDERFKDIVSAYRSVVESYNNAFKQKRNVHGNMNEHYPRIMGDLAGQYNSYTDSKYSYSTFIDHIAQSLIPPDIYSDMYEDALTKADIVRTIMVKTVNRFTVYILVNQMEKALSENIRNSKDPLQLREINHEWKEKFKEMLLQQRSEYYSLVMAKRHGVNIDGPESIDMVPASIVKKLEVKMREIIDDKNKAIMERNKITDYARILRDRVNELESIFESINESQQTPKLVPQSITQTQTPLPVSTPPIQVQVHNPINDIPVEALPAVAEMLKTTYNAAADIKPVTVEDQLEEIDADQIDSQDDDIDLDDNDDMEPDE